MKSPFLPGHLKVNHNWHRPVGASLGALYNIHNIHLGNFYNISFLMQYVEHARLPDLNKNINIYAKYLV